VCAESTVLLPGKQGQAAGRERHLATVIPSADYKTVEGVFVRYTD
jgi:hypothetical protein